MTVPATVPARQAAPCRAGAPPCNPDTLRGTCVGGCGRRMHTSPTSRRGLSKAVCERGHPVHEGHGRCPRCRAQQRRADSGIPTKQPKQRVPLVVSGPHPYCVHDEGESCDCATELRGRAS